tara:strand:- start:431 stop:1234 length:804 start_codon:yes stop_codon:yes gene_type:complete
LNNNSKPIGIFDSGLGGLTLLNKMKCLFPNETFIYFGDTAHLPYGSKSKQTIELYSKKIVDFLILKDVKLIIIACNTASSLASECLKKNYSIPIIEVITPCVVNALKHTVNNFIGVIGTLATINSKIYSKKIYSLNGNVTVKEVACPLLVPIIEEGWHLDIIAKKILTKYLDNFKTTNIDSLILGCTHYSIMKKDIVQYFGDSINIITSSNSINTTISNVLKMNNLNSNSKNNEDSYFVTDLGQTFKEQAQALLGLESINIQLINPL